MKCFKKLQVYEYIRFMLHKDKTDTSLKTWTHKVLKLLTCDQTERILSALTGHLHRHSQVLPYFRKE